MSRVSGFRLEFIPMKIGAGMTFLEEPNTPRKKKGEGDGERTEADATPRVAS